MKEITEIGTNKKAYYSYTILKTYESGIVLLGTEVKSLKMKNMNFCNSYASFKNKELFLFDLKIEPYLFGSHQNHNLSRIRKILLKKSELKKLEQTIQEKGISIIPLKIYIKNNKIKILLGIAKGKTYSDKRETIKDRETAREISSVLKKRAY